MPSTRRQKAKARRSREMDMMSDFDNLDVMVGNDNNINPIGVRVIEESSVQYDTESNLPAIEDFSQENEFRNQNYGSNIPRHEGILETLETFTNEVNLRRMGRWIP